MDISENNQKLVNILRKNHVLFAALFGSRAKGSDHELSDYDILIDTDPKVGFSLFDHVGLKNELESALGSKVDLVTVGGLNRHMRDNVNATMKVIYDER